MKKFFNFQETKQRYLSSCKEIANTKNLVLCGLLCAIAVILGTLASVQIGPYIRINFSGIPNRFVDALFGPVIGLFFGAATDIIKYILNPTGPFTPGFTLSAMLTGLIYGTMLYKRPFSLKRIIIAELIEKLFVNCFLDTLWLSMIYEKGMLVLLPLRILKNVIMLPIDTVILFFLLTYMKKVVTRLGFFTQPKKNNLTL